jgi:hypothetical protein
LLICVYINEKADSFLSALISSYLLELQHFTRIHNTIRVE